jgi:hypothetical protein
MAGQVRRSQGRKPDPFSHRGAKLTGGGVDIQSHTSVHPAEDIFIAQATAIPASPPCHSAILHPGTRQVILSHAQRHPGLCSCYAAPSRSFLARPTSTDTRASMRMTAMDLGLDKCHTNKYLPTEYSNKIDSARATRVNKARMSIYYAGFQICR